MSDLSRGRLIAILEDARLQIRSYSGRNMNGETCVGAVAEPMQRQVIVKLLRHCVDIPECAALVHGMDVDHMGKDYIYYWKEFVAGPEEFE